MGGEWQQYQVSDLISEGLLTINDGYRAKNSELSRDGLPFARAGNIRNGFHFQDADHFPEEDLHKVGQKVSRPGDVVFTSKGTVGRFAYVSPEIQPFIYSPQLCFWRSNDQESIHSRYLYYWMHGAEFLHQFSGVKGQTDMADYVSLRDQRAMKITLPRIDIQKALAHILGSLDDKIELNRQMNRTLEQMAQALFKSWFIDFDPVVYNAAQAGNPIPERFQVTAKRYRQNPEIQTLPQHILDLFPDRFEDSELGEIPAGWSVKSIGDIVNCVGGATPSTKNPDFWEDGENPFLTPKDMSSLFSPVITDTSRHITNAGVEKISSKQIPAGSVMLSSRAPIGYLGINVVPMSINQGIIAMICDDELTNHYVLQWTMANMDVIKSKAGGTTFAEISKKNFRSIPILVPDNRSLTEFSRQIEPWHQQITENSLANNTLGITRDTLLPKLVSGELRIMDTRRLLEDA